MLAGLSEEQNKELESMHIQAINEAERFLKIYRMSKLRKYLILAECEIATARAYLKLGDFDPDVRLCEM